MGKRDLSAPSGAVGHLLGLSPQFLGLPGEARVCSSSLLPSEIGLQATDAVMPCTLNAAGPGWPSLALPSWDGFVWRWSLRSLFPATTEGCCLCLNIPPHCPPATGNVTISRLSSLKMQLLPRWVTVEARHCQPCEL